MAVHTKHPVSAPPTAPVREKTRHLMLRAWCVFVLFTALSGTGWVHAFGEPVAAAITIAGGVLSIGIWIAARPLVNWRRLPWFLVAYVTWALSSLLWTHWLGATAVTLLLLGLTTLQGFFVGAMLTWREIVRALGAALKWVMAVSILFELWVSVVVRAPVLPGFVVEKAADPILYWSRDNLFSGGRIQGIMGNSNLLGPVALLAIVVFALLFAARAQRRVALGLWIALSAYLLYRASSATAYLAAAAVVVVLVTILLMRRAARPGQRTKYYIAYAVIGIGSGVSLWLLRDTIFTLLGRSGDLTGRESIWQAVLDRVAEHPVIGWGFSTPWVVNDPSFAGWIIDHGESVQQAHNMWIDVLFQLGIIGLVILVTTYLAFVWRAWFFAVDRPRWDLRADRPYSPFTLLPSLFAIIVIVQGVSESGPLLVWGWMLLVLFAFKIKQAPHIGAGPAEQSFAIEQDLTRSPAGGGA